MVVLRPHGRLELLHQDRSLFAVHRPMLHLPFGSAHYCWYQTAETREGVSHGHQYERVNPLVHKECAHVFLCVIFQTCLRETSS